MAYYFQFLLLEQCAGVVLNFLMDPDGYGQSFNFFVSWIVNQIF